MLASRTGSFSTQNTGTTRRRSHTPTRHTRPVVRDAADCDTEGRLVGLEVLDAVRRFGDQATMQRVMPEASPESTSVLREQRDQEYWTRGPARSGPNWGGDQ